MNEVFIVAWLVYMPSEHQNVKADQAAAKSPSEACSILKAHVHASPHVYIAETHCADIYCIDHKTAIQPVRLICAKEDAK